MILELKNSTIKFTSSTESPTEVALTCNVSDVGKQFQHFPPNLSNAINVASSVTNKFMIVDVSAYQGKVITFVGYNAKSTLSSKYCCWASALKSGETITSLINATAKITDAVVVTDDSWYFGLATADANSEYVYSLTIPQGANYLITDLMPNSEAYAKVRL